MSEHIISYTVLRIREGGLGRYKQLAEEIVRLVEAKNPRMIALSLVINEAGTEARSVQVHPDSESFEFHMGLAASQMQEAMDYIEVLEFEVLGTPTDSLRAKFEAFDEPQRYWPLFAGFARSPTS